MGAYRVVNSLTLMQCSVLAFLCIIFYGCKKCDFPGKYESTCRVVSINEEYGDKQVFHYNSWGDPEFIDIENQGTGRPDFYFKYDNQKRLVELQARYTAEDNFERITRYYYESGKIVKDSSFIFPSPDNLYFYAFTEGQYLYDNYDRIVQYSYVRYSGDMDGGGFEETLRDTTRYSYPAEDPYKGNRNYLAGNRVLMFVNQYYQKTTPADSYNELGYPTRFSTTEIPSMLGYDVFDIQYDCSGSMKAR